MKIIARLLFVATVCGVLPGFGGVISVQPLTTLKSAGTNFSLDVNVSGAADLAAFQFDVGFDPTVLRANSVAEGPLFPAVGATIFFPGLIDNSGGTISFVADLLLTIAGANGDGTLATISFTALSPGSSAVGVFNVTALNSFGEGVGFAAVNAGVDVTPRDEVPEPSAVVLLAAGLAAVLGRRWVRSGA